MMPELVSAPSSIDQLIRKVISIHFDPHSGTPYWLRREQELGIDARRDIRYLEELAILGPMDENALRDRPIEEMTPQSEWNNRSHWIVAETGGTTGRSKYAVHREDEFFIAFVAPFVAAAKRIGFPRFVNWLYIGPSGPHIIGKAARACSKALGSPDPFAVDFDPRWAKKMPENSFSRQRYLQHIVDQASTVLRRQSIGAIFSTPPVLQALSAQMDEKIRRQIKGIHFGGIALSPSLRRALSQSFPNAVLLSGYGNTLFGMAPELNASDEGIDYFPFGKRMLYQVIEIGGLPDSERISHIVDYDRRGQVLAHRLDETQLIPNLIERDTAVRIPPFGYEEGIFCQDGIRNPLPLLTQSFQPTIGLY